MPTKLFCGICGREIERQEDKRILSITKENGVDVRMPKEMCVFCMIEVDEFVKGLSGKGVERGNKPLL